MKILKLLAVTSLLFVAASCAHSGASKKACDKSKCSQSSCDKMKDCASKNSCDKKE